MASILSSIYEERVVNPILDRRRAATKSTDAVADRLQPQAARSLNDTIGEPQDAACRLLYVGFQLRADVASFVKRGARGVVGNGGRIGLTD